MIKKKLKKKIFNILKSSHRFKLFKHQLSLYKYFYIISLSYKSNFISKNTMNPVQLILFIYYNYIFIVYSMFFWKIIFLKKTKIFYFNFILMEFFFIKFSWLYAPLFITYFYVILIFLLFHFFQIYLKFFNTNNIQSYQNFEKKNFYNIFILKNFYTYIYIWIFLFNDINIFIYNYNFFFFL